MILIYLDLFNINEIIEWYNTGLLAFHTDLPVYYVMGNTMEK